MQEPSIQDESPDRRQLLITLSVPENEIVKVESFDETGKSVDLPEKEFAALVGEHDVVDLLLVLEQIYMTELFDVDGDLEVANIEIEFDDELEPVVVRRVTNHRLIRSELKKLILSRLWRRASLAVRRLTQGGMDADGCFGASRRFFH